MELNELIELENVSVFKVDTNELSLVFTNGDVLEDYLKVLIKHSKKREKKNEFT